MIAPHNYIDDLTSREGAAQLAVRLLVYWDNKISVWIERCEVGYVVRSNLLRGLPR